MNNILKLVIIEILLFSSCKGRNNENSSIVSIDIETNIDNMQQVNLSKFTDNIKYVPLETIENLPLPNLAQVDISGDLIFICVGGTCLLYDTEGHFISKIGNKGRGPGEYPTASNSGLGRGSNKKAFISSLYDIFEYNFDGSFVNKYTNSLLNNDIYDIRDWHIFDDSLFIGRIDNRTGQMGYKAMIFNKYGNVKHYFKNYILFNIENEINNALEGNTHLFRFNGTVFFKEQFNDTLFSIDEKYEQIPKYIFNLGSLKMPLSERVKRPFGLIMRDYIFTYDIFQTEKLLLLYCDFGNRSPAKRLTPRTGGPGAPEIWYNTTAVLGIFDKKSEELVFCKPSDTDNPLFTSGIYNDIDGGPRFFPKFQVNDSTLLMWVKPDELINHVSSDDFKNSIPKYPEKKKELEELANSLTIFDNPVLMFVTFKK